MRKLPVVLAMLGATALPIRSEESGRPRRTRRRPLPLVRTTDWSCLNETISGRAVATNEAGWGEGGTRYRSRPVSIETRPEAGEWVHPLASLFKQFELLYVVGNKRDLAGVRFQHRAEDVFLYRIRATPEAARRL